MKKIELELNPLKSGVMLIWERIEESAVYKVRLYARKNCYATNKNIFEIDARLPARVNFMYAKKYDLNLKNDNEVANICDDIDIKMNLIDEIEVEKRTCYLSIKDLAQLIVKIRINYINTYYKTTGSATLTYSKGYFVEVIAEDKNGNEVAKSGLINFAPGLEDCNTHKQPISVNMI